MRNKIVAVIVFFCCIIAGCLPSPYFQRVETLPGSVWSYSNKPVFKFNITGSTATYQPYFILRHSQAYPFNNIWMLVHIKQPGDTLIKTERVNIVLAESSGKWMGRGMGELYEQRMFLKLSDIALFNKAGTYEISLEQNMRVDPLPEILNVGLRVEKTGYKVAGRK